MNTTSPTTITTVYVSNSASPLGISVPMPPVVAAEMLSREANVDRDAVLADLLLGTSFEVGTFTFVPEPAYR